MQCNTDHTAQLLTDADNVPVMAKGTIYLRYPSDGRDKIDGAAKDICTAEANKLIQSYNLFNNPKVNLDHVNVTEIKQTGGSQGCGGILGNECHWDYHGEAKCEIYVKCQ
ncbi:hypothetical protein [Paenibacillus polysaccharolyticus]|uniref:hypothetical protein n=1 Tax=Paenibacillus polysaccharolyticus TaxID=582692 RepID=UPI00280C1C8B|nr:hypothetical protein [Paenibacillus polysaccharolyticus]